MDHHGLVKLKSIADLWTLAAHENVFALPWSNALGEQVILAD